MTYYSKAALFDAFRGVARRRTGAQRPVRRRRARGEPSSTRARPRYDQSGKPIVGVERVFDTRVFEGNVWGLEWFDRQRRAQGHLPAVLQARWRASRGGGGRGRAGGNGAARAAVQAGRPAAAVHVADHGRMEQAWRRARPVHRPIWSTAPWSPTRWYRFVDQPSFQQYRWSENEEGEAAGPRREAPRHLADRPRLHAAAHPGTLVSLDPGLLVTPPPGLESGYVPIVTRQAMP